MLVFFHAHLVSKARLSASSVAQQLTFKEACKMPSQVTMGESETLMHHM